MKKRRFEVLADLIKQNGWTKGAEIGVYKGATFFYLLDHCPELHLIGVDSWLPLPSTQIKDTNKGLSSYSSQTPGLMVKYFEDVTKKAAQNRRATILCMDTVEAAAHIEDGSLDFIFVDADHATESVLADVGAWRPKVREGGWLIGHDAQWGSVRRALQQLFPAGWRVHSDNVWSVP
jgi:predicted O-methyltransferase YrrM